MKVLLAITLLISVAIAQEKVDIQKIDIKGMGALGYNDGTFKPAKDLTNILKDAQKDAKKMQREVLGAAYEN